MLDSKGFDLWANGYDKSVNLSEDNDEYPYRAITNTCFLLYLVK